MDVYAGCARNAAEGGCEKVLGAWAHEELIARPEARARALAAPSMALKEADA